METSEEKPGDAEAPEPEAPKAEPPEVEPPRGRPRRTLIAAVAVLTAATAATAIAINAGGDDEKRSGPAITDIGRPGPAPRAWLSEVRSFEPFPYEEEKEDELRRRGRDALANVLYRKSPLGVAASARRTARWRAQIERAAEDHGVEPDLLEALVFLESAGRPEVMAGGTPDSAVGLAQIIPSAATDLLGMRVDLAESISLTRRIERDRRSIARYEILRPSTAKGRRVARKRLRAARERLPRLEERRRTVDERFDPEKALDGAGRYLEIARERFGRSDLALVSYHMGIGNLERVIRTYVRPRRVFRTSARNVREYDLTWPRIFFDSTPRRNPKTHAVLDSFSDDSRTYSFRVDAAREIMRLHRTDRDALAALAELHTAKASAENVLRPPDDTEIFGDGDDLRGAYEDGDLVRIPEEPERLGFQVARGMGELARRLGERPALYRGMRPEALGVLLYASKEVRLGTGLRRPLVLTSGVRDVRYQSRLIRVNAQATRAYSVHTTGYAFDLRKPGRRAQREGLVDVLERLRALNVISWVEEPGAYHVAVGPDGERYLPLVEALP